MRNTKALMSISLAAILSAIAQFAVAQQPAAPAAQNPVTAQVDYSDQEIDMFAESYQAISKVRDKYMSELEQAQTDEQANKIQIAANEEMVKQIGRYGLTAEQYNEMAQAMQNNPQLLEKVLQKLE